MSCKSYKKHTLAKNIGEEIITFKVGKDKQIAEITVHKKLIMKIPYWGNRDDIKLADPGTVILLKDDDPLIWKLFVEWLYHGTVPKPETKISVKVMPAPPVIAALEINLLQRFNKTQENLVGLYAVAEKYSVNDLMNKTIDNIQDGYHEYGTVFGPGLNRQIFAETKKGSKLRDLCVGTNIIHTDRGCSKLRKEIIASSIEIPAYFSHLIKWISRNNAMFARRASEGPFERSRRFELFSMLNRKKLCPCHLHVHDKGTAHKDHDRCEIPFLNCSHPEDESDDEEQTHDDAMASFVINMLSQAQTIS